MKKPIPLILFSVAFLIILTVGLIRIAVERRDRNIIAALVLYNPACSKEQRGVVNAYRSVLEEEGVPYKLITPFYLLSRNYNQVLKTKPVIIVPDTVAQSLPADVGLWFRNYLIHGGNALLVYDCGTRNRKGAFLDRTMFADMAGINFITYKTNKTTTYTRGKLRFRGHDSAEFFQIPEGKLSNDFMISGYHYGALDYPVARTEPATPPGPITLFADAITGDGKTYPAVVLTKYGQGNVLYVNFPMGYLKAYSDELLLRATLRTFLFRIVRMPHLVNTPLAKGGLVINWHIDASIDWKSIPFMQKNGFLRKDLKYSMHITAGDFCDAPGDRLGFDAGGTGKPYVQALMPFGAIGSHGGWAHNWFALSLRDGKMTPKQSEEYIRKNTECLERVTGEKVLEYAAPAGVFPQPETSAILERLGIMAYYSTSDSGSAPNRAFVKGRMVSSRLIAFPIMPFGKLASIMEMIEAPLPAARIKQNFCDIVDFAVRNRTIRMMYSHPYDIQYAVQPVKAFLDYAERIQREKKLAVLPMSKFAGFLLRFLKTNYRFTVQPDGLDVTLHNPEGLQEITVAIPRSNYTGTTDSSMRMVDEDDDYYYLTTGRPAHEKTFHCPAR